MCICSNTWAEQCRTVLTRLGIDEYFDFYIEARGAMSKSSPAPFMEALHRLGGTEPAGCAVCEDALYAAQTAHDAGFYLVGIQDTTSAADAPLCAASATSSCRTGLHWTGRRRKVSQNCHSAALL